MASCSFPDVFCWIQNIPPTIQWTSNSISICICPSSSSHPSLNLITEKGSNPRTLVFSIIVDFTLPVYLWTSRHFKINPNCLNPLDKETIYDLMMNFIEAVLCYGSKRNVPPTRIPEPDLNDDLGNIFNLVFFTLSLLVCVYEAPVAIRLNCLDTIKSYLVSCRLRQSSYSLVKLLGSNIEEQWMRSLNLAITNWFMELERSHRGPRTPSTLFSYAVSTFGLWKVQLYCPVMAMDIEHSSNPLADSRLLFSLNFHQLEGVIQFNYRVVIREKWVDIIVKIDNIRYDVIRLVNEHLMSKRGAGEHEKHFPSRILLQLTPTLQTNITSVSVSKSSDNPGREVEIAKGIEGTFDPPDSLFSLTVSAGETMKTSMKPWKLEQSVHGNSVNLNWLLYDSVDGKEVFSSKPSRFAMINPRAWFKERYKSVFRPFTRGGGVIFAGDEYGESICWRVDTGAIGKTMEWEMRGWVWLTYWPNKYKTLYHETRRLEFRELLNLKIA